MNNLFYSFVLVICTWFVAACAATSTAENAATNIATNTAINSCDDVIAYFNQFSSDDAKKNLKLEVLPEVVSDATEGSEGALYRDDSEEIRVIELIHYAGTGKKIVNYTILDEQNYRVDISRIFYEKPINTVESAIEKDRLNKRTDICDGIEVDVYADRPESNDLRTYPLNELLQSLSNER